MKLNSLKLLCVMALTACGGTTPPKTSEVKIIGGERVTEDQALARSTVALVSQDGTAFCSGTLVSPYHVLTAAHCVALFPKDHPFFVGFGTEIREGKIKLSQMRSVKKTTLHEKFDREKLKKQLEEEKQSSELRRELLAEAKAHEADGSLNETVPADEPSEAEVKEFGEKMIETLSQREASFDIAVLQMSGPAPAGTVPAKIFPAGGFALPEALPLTVAGYGLTSLDPLLAKPEDAEATASESEPETGVLNRLDLFLLKTLKGSSEFMLIGEEPGKAVCHGDSGGPAFFAGKDPLTGKDFQYLVGVAGASDCMMIAFYTDIRPFAKFVHQTVLDDLTELIEAFGE